MSYASPEGVLAAQLNAAIEAQRPDMEHAEIIKAAEANARDMFNIKNAKTYVFWPQNTPERDGKVAYAYGLIGEANAYRRELESHYGVKYKVEEVEAPDARRLWNDNRTHVAFIYGNI